MLQTIGTADRMATLHVDHEEMDLWVDFQPEHDGTTMDEVRKLAEAEGCGVMHPDEMPPEHRPNGVIRFYLHYLEVTECP